MEKTEIQVSGKTVYANGNTCNVKLGSKGKALPAGIFYAGMSKGDARRLRKQFRYFGFGAIAGAARC